MTSITVGILPTADAVPLLVAYKEGDFSRAGLNVTLKFMAGGAVIAPAVSQGSIQIGEGTPLTIMANVEQGFPLKFIAPTSATTYPSGSAKYTYTPNVSTHILAVLSSSNIHTWKDLTGKTIATNTHGSFTEAAIMQSLKDNGVDPSTISIVTISPPDWLGTLQQKRVDAVDFFEPFATQLVVANQTAPTAGAFRVIGDIMHLGNVTQAGYFATSAWISSHPDVVKSFISALNAGVKATAANNTLARSVLVSFLNMSPAVASKVVLYTYPISPVPYTWYQTQISLGLTWGLLKNSNDDASQIVDPTYMQLSR